MDFSTKSIITFMFIFYTYIHNAGKIYTGTYYIDKDIPKL